MPDASALSTHRLHAAIAGQWTLPALGPFSGIERYRILVGLHLMDLCFGLGAAMLHFWIFRWLR